MLIKERAMVHFFDRFSDHPFVIRMDGHEDKIGEGTPAFVVNLKFSSLRRKNRLNARLKGVGRA